MKTILLLTLALTGIGCSTLDTVVDDYGSTPGKAKLIEIANLTPGNYTYEIGAKPFLTDKGQPGFIGPIIATPKDALSARRAMGANIYMREPGDRPYLSDEE